MSVCQRLYLLGGEDHDDGLSQLVAVLGVESPHQGGVEPLDQAGDGCRSQTQLRVEVGRRRAGAGRVQSRLQKKYLREIFSKNIKIFSN